MFIFLIALFVVLFPLFSWRLKTTANTQVVLRQGLMVTAVLLIGFAVLHWSALSMMEWVILGLGFGICYVAFLCASFLINVFVHSVD
jgi:hypothetical protein